MIIDRAAYDAMIQHMREAAPREGVGLLAGPRDRPACSRDTNGDGDCGRPLCPECGAGGGRVDRWVPLRNSSPFPGLRYEIDPQEQIAAYEAVDADGRWPWIHAHSHVRSSAAPSPLDIRYATDPNLLHMIVSIAGSDPVPVLWRLSPDAPAGQQAVKIRYQVVDLGFHGVPATDLTRDVSGRSV
jgi:proteasome lid subunit RPN8/RPN11